MASRNMIREGFARPSPSAPSGRLRDCHIGGSRRLLGPREQGSAREPWALDCDVLGREERE